MTNTENTPTDSFPVTLVCTLDTKDRAKRALEWGDLGALSLTSEPIHGGVASTYPVELEDQIKDLANKEQSCCGSWLDSTVVRVGDIVRLEITTKNPDGLAIIRSMSGLDG